MLTEGSVQGHNDSLLFLASYVIVNYFMAEKLNTVFRR